MLGSSEKPESGRGNWSHNLMKRLMLHGLSSHKNRNFLVCATRDLLSHILLTHSDLSNA